MAILKLTAEPRDETGTRAVRALRASGFIPANLYSEGKPSTLLKLDGARWTKALADELHLVALEIDGGASHTVAVREIQRDPLTQEILHVDFQGVKMDVAMQFTVRVEFLGTPEGVKIGGIQSVSRDHVEVECLPADVPESLSIDVSGLGMGESVNAGALTIPEGVKLLSDPQMVLVSIVAPRAAAEEEKPAEEVEAEEKEAEEKEEGEAPKEAEKEES